MQTKTIMALTLSVNIKD